MGLVSMPGPMSLLGVGMSGPRSILGVDGYVWGMGMSKAVGMPRGVGMYTPPLKMVLGSTLP